MNIQDWLSQLLATAEPLDWERYSVTMAAATWKALWADIEATQEYDDGLEAALRLLQATQVHRPRLGTRGVEANEILLYRSVLAMLDKADRWDTYLAVWETIWAQTRLCLLVSQDTLAGGATRYTPFVRRSDGGFGAAPPVYGVAPPKTVALHFLYAQWRRKAAIERKLGQKNAGTLFTERRPLGSNALSAEAIQSRLAQVHQDGP
jgi:hypothetical protein